MINTVMQNLINTARQNLLTEGTGQGKRTLPVQKVVNLVTDFNADELEEFLNSLVMSFGSLWEDIEDGGDTKTAKACRTSLKAFASAWAARSGN